MEREENHKTVSLSSHRPWKSLARFPHSHRADNRFPFPQNQNRKDFPATGLPSSVQAHSSMRKCFPAIGTSPVPVLLAIDMKTSLWY
jgi:hypothetical protein